MCLIIDKPAGKAIDESTVRNAAYNNPHGWGIMYAENGEVQTLKGMKAEDLISILSDLTSRHVIYHFRQATHGAVNLENCHPFQVTDNIYLCHNGIISVPDIDTNMSDTYVFCHYVLGPILRENPSLFGTDHLAEIIEGFDESSKFALLRSDGETQIINRESGFEDNGIWYSNRYSLTLPVPVDRSWRYTKETAPKPYYAKSLARYDSSYSEIWNDEKESDLIYPKSYDELLAMEYDPLLRFCESCPEEVADLIWSATDFDLMRQ